MVLEGQPYIGLRPFDTSDRHLFFGRDNDARLLRNKVFSASLILLYAPSGVGKTSLLRARLVPDLAEAQAAVLYFDKWANHRPVETLKASLVELADGQRQQELASLSLVDLVGALIRHNGKTIAIVLDQFEQLLLESAEVRTALVSELAALVRSNLDVRLVLSLREELIASLHPLREHIPTLFQSTFRLEHFGDEQAREAIVEPARIYGASVEDELVRAMLVDLRTSQTTASPTDGSVCQDGIELPFLQIICEHLWNESRGSEVRALTCETYERVGKRDGIVGAYVKKITEQLGGPAKTDLANLLTFLAPPSGIKRSYTVQDLEAHAGIPRARIQPVLKHLADCAVVIQRQADAGPAYELSHDAFARVLSPWANEHLSAEKRDQEHRAKIRQFRRDVLRVIMGIGCLVVMYLLGRKFEAAREESRSTEGVLEALRRDKSPVNVPVKINGVVGYLFGRDDADRQRLYELLERYKDVIPATLGLDRPKVTIATSIVEENWPLTLQYGDKLTLDKDLLQSYWGATAKEFASEWGIPVPIRLRLIANPRLSPDAIEILSPGGDSPVKRTIYVPTNSDELFVWRNEIPSDLLSLVHDRGKQWVRYEIEKSDSEALYVPRWTLPLWANKEVPLRGKEAWIACSLREQIKRSPEIIVNEYSVAALLKHVLGSSVAVTRRLGESRKSLTSLSEELVERFRKGSYLKHAARVLEDLLPERLPSVRPPPPSGARSPYDPRQRVGFGRSYRYLGQTAPYNESLASLPAQVDVVSVRIHADQAHKLSAVAERLVKVRTDFFQRFGLLAPRIEVLAAADMKEDDYRIDLPLDGPNNQIAGKVESSEALVRSVGDRVADLLAEKRTEWLTSTLNVVMGRLPQRLSDRLEDYYNTSELMTALRGVFAETAESGPTDTIAQPSWLLGSLVFFKTTDPSLRPDAVGDLLRRAQAARLEANAEGSVDSNMVKGINALVGDEVEKAEGFFKRLSARSEVREQFLRIYAQRSLAMEVDHLLSESNCEEPDLDDLPSLSPRLTNDDADARGVSHKVSGTERREKSLAVADEYTLTTMHALVDDERISREQRLKLGICIWTRFAREEMLDGRRSPFDLLKLLSDESSIEAFLVVHLILAAHDSSLPPDHLAEVREQLAKALPRLNEMDAILAFSDLDQQCSRVKDPVWCNELITKLSEGERSSPTILRLVGQRLTKSPKLAQDIDRGLAMLDQADLLAPASPDDESKLARVEGHINRAGYETEDLQRQALVVDEMLTRSPDPMDILSIDRRSRLYQLRGLIKLMSNDATGAEQAVKAGMDKLKPDAGLMGVQLLSLLETAQTYGTSQWFEADMAPKEPEVLLQRAFASLVTDNSGAEFRARDLFAINHEYRDYIRLMLWTWLTLRGETGKAQQLLSDRTRTIDKEKWDERLRQGDPTPWREKLIAYYAGEIQRKDIFGPLESEESFRSSPLFGIGLSRRILRCEAHFYEAWLHRAHGASLEYRNSLEEVRATTAAGVLEYHAAKYLLAKFDEEVALGEDRRHASDRR